MPYSEPALDSIRWDEVGREATEILSRYIRIDTSNPPGDEDAAADFLRDLLADEGVDAVRYERARGRANLIARLDAEQPVGPPLLLLHHMDVVPATASNWSLPPFGGVVSDGYVWGRGAIDDKGLGTIQLMAFILLKRLRVMLKRPVVLMAVADEEEGGPHGARWMVEHHWADIECEYVWDEGGIGSVGLIGDRPVFAISVSEKRSMVVRLIAKGAGGHGSMAGNTAVDRLVRALSVLERRGAKLRFDDVSRAFFRGVAGTRGFPASWLMRHAGSPLLRPLVRRIVDRVPSISAMLTDTVTATVLRAGRKSNVVPDTAEAVLDVRLLSDTDAREFVQQLERAVGDGSVSLEAGELPPIVPPSAMGSEMFDAFRRAIETHVPDAVVVPMQTPVATDSRFFRARGVNAYGLIPAVLTPEELGSVHGVNERLSVGNLVLGVKIALDVILGLCAQGPRES
ncbi:MAG: M20/M25/M40 family metallo-hydrolase [Chloroflexi bacterium]|nr:M20/M25/M40 family metallo-hydrolase [Chloroflexota bacterium]